MAFGDLPSEIHSRILWFCLPSDLALLSRVHTTVRDIAEYALYSRIQYRVRPSDLMTRILSRRQKMKGDRSLWHTLANNSQKASMVKMFYVELEYVLGEDGPALYEKSTRFILIQLAEALVKMSNLADLRILHDQMDDLEGARRISEVIRGDYFKLHTLYIEYYHYLKGMVADKPHLQLLGIHSASLDRSPRIKKIHQDLSRCRTMPTVFMLADLFEGPTITMFPLHHPGKALRACREVATFLTNWHGFFGNDRYHLSVDLFGISEENISLLSELMEAMVTCLQDYCPRGSAHFSVIIHEESIQKLWQFPEFVKPLALFEDTKTLNVVYPEIDDEKWYQMATDLEFCMVTKLEDAWPSLQKIRFFCDNTSDVLVMKRESSWKVVEYDKVLAVISDDDSE